MANIVHLRDRLRAGDIWVESSRAYRRFEDYLLPPAAFAALRAEGRLGIALPDTAAAWLEQRGDVLREKLRAVLAAAAEGQLAYATLNEAGLRVAPSRGATRRIAIHCACHDRVEEDERLLLDALCLVQMGRLSWALHLLRGMATDAAARAALSSAQGLGTELALAGCYLHADGPAESPSEADGYPATAAAPCPATLH